jgi:hypothetical protein
MNLQGEIGHRFDNHWNVYAGHGVGVVGRETFLGLDWTVQAGGAMGVQDAVDSRTRV